MKKQNNKTILDKFDSEGNPIPEKYQNPKKLGFLRVLMIMYGFGTCLILMICLIYSKDIHALNVASFDSVVSALGYAVIFWMLWKRKKDTKYVVLALAIFEFIVSFTLCLKSGDFTNLIMCTLIDTVTCLYLWFSKRAKYRLTEPFISEPDSKEFDTKRDYYQPKTWAFWRDMIIMFCVFSVVGHWLEAAYCLPVKLGWLPGIYDPTSQIWSDWLFPFPIYGAGAVACALIFYPIKNALQKVIKVPFVSVLLVFLISGIVCSLMELIMGLCVNQDLRLWDYSTMWCNFMGQVCLQNSIGFGIAATIMTFVVYPLIKALIAKLPKDGANILFVAVVVFFSMLMIFYYINDFTITKETYDEIHSNYQ